MKERNGSNVAKVKKMNYSKSENKNMKKLYQTYEKVATD